MKNPISQIWNKYRSMHIEAKASIWYTICNLLQKGIAFIVVPIYVRVLTTAEYGRYTTFQTWKDILIIFASLNLYCGVFTKAMVDLKTSEERDRYTSSMQGLTLLISSIFFVVYIAASGLWNKLLDTNTVNMVLMFAYFVMFPSFNFWSVRKKVENKYVSMVIITLLVSVATPILSLILLYQTGMREDALIRGFLVTQITVGAVFFVYQFIRGKCIFNKNYWKKAVSYNIPLIPHYLSLMILGQADRIMIKKICGDGDAGIYSLAYSISTLMNVFIAAVNSAMVPWVYNKMRLKEYRRIYEITRPVLIMMGGFTLLLTICAPEIIGIVGTKEYMSSIWVIPAVSLGIFYTFCYNLYCNVEFYYSKTKYVMVASSVGAVLNILLNAVFIPLYGFIAAGYTTMVCYLVFMIVHFAFMKHVCKIENIDEPIFDNKFILFVSVMLSIICLSIQFAYPYLWLRIILMALLCVIAYIKRDVIKVIISMKKNSK